METKEQVEKILSESPEAIIKRLPTILALSVIAKVVGGPVQRHWDFYGRLLFHFAKAHPAQAAVLAGVFAQLADSGDKRGKGSAFAGASAAALAFSIAEFKSEFQRSEIKKRLKTGKRRHDSMVLPKKGTVFTGDGDTFFEVIYKLGDSPPCLKQFTFTDGGAKKFRREERIFDGKALMEFMNVNRLVDVTDCICPGTESFEF